MISSKNDPLPKVPLKLDLKKNKIAPLSSPSPRKRSLSDLFRSVQAPPRKRSLSDLFRSVQAPPRKRSLSDLFRSVQAPPRKRSLSDLFRSVQASSPVQKLSASPHHPLENWPNVSYAFSAAFYAWPYHLGVASYIQESGLYSAASRFYGTSSGGLAAVYLACGINIEKEALDATLASNDEHIDGHLTPYFHPESVRATFFKHIAPIFPSNAHSLASGRFFAVVCELPRVRRRYISQFPSRQALFNAILATMSVPGLIVWFAYRSENPRLKWCLDGALVENISKDNRPDWSTIRVATWRQHSVLWPVAQNDDIFPSEPISLKMRYMVETTEHRKWWFRLGKRDAQKFFEKAHLTSSHNMRLPAHP